MRIHGFGSKTKILYQTKMPIAVIVIICITGIIWMQSGPVIQDYKNRQAKQTCLESQERLCSPFTRSVQN